MTDRFTGLVTCRCGESAGDSRPNLRFSWSPRTRMRVFWPVCCNCCTLSICKGRRNLEAGNFGI